METNLIFPAICGGWFLFMAGFLTAGLLAAAKRERKPLGSEDYLVKLFKPIINEDYLHTESGDDHILIYMPFSEWQPIKDWLDQRIDLQEINTLSEGEIILSVRDADSFPVPDYYISTCRIANEMEDRFINTCRNCGEEDLQVFLVRNGLLASGSCPTDNKTFHELTEIKKGKSE